MVPGATRLPPGCMPGFQSPPVDRPAGQLRPLEVSEEKFVESPAMLPRRFGGASLGCDCPCAQKRLAEGFCGGIEGAVAEPQLGMAGICICSCCMRGVSMRRALGGVCLPMSTRCPGPGDATRYRRCPVPMMVGDPDLALRAVSTGATTSTATGVASRRHRDGTREKPSLEVARGMRGLGTPCTPSTRMAPSATSWRG